MERNIKPQLEFGIRQFGRVLMAAALAPRSCQNAKLQTDSAGNCLTSYYPLSPPDTSSISLYLSFPLSATLLLFILIAREFGNWSGVFSRGFPPFSRRLSALVHILLGVFPPS